LKKICCSNTDIQWIHNISAAKDLNELEGLNQTIFNPIFEKKDFINDKGTYRRNIQI
jgi:hypothetical protein